VNNFDFSEIPEELLKLQSVTLIEHRLDWLGSALRRIVGRQGSMENAIGIDSALQEHSEFEWAFMAHSDSAPLAFNWDDAYFEALGQGLIVGNYRDRIRIHAAHASGTLFSQRQFLRARGQMWPVFKRGQMILDVGDRATAILHDLRWGQVPVLPNTINDPKLISKIEARYPLLGEFAKTGSCIALDSAGQIPVFGHLGRGTPRNMKDPRFSQRPPVETWVQMISEVKGRFELC